MKVYERINEILKAKKITKKELAQRLINLDMRANKTGEVPTFSSIYAYLNGNIDLKADMLPFIAEALGVCEQEFFSTEDESDKIIQKIYAKDESMYKYKKIIALLEYASPKTIKVLEQALFQHKIKTDEFNKNIQKIF
ncbi:XRE family transcriptional regulator [Campylobacter sp. MIT 12-8780]|uniref:helix-turn-helix domain-containing protein n=1 Tax=unclassified Campylobacter TaxID=2593542 RepID=UPI0010F6C555|nr:MULTISPECIES: helix-turn-helix transcriptional regulator [unclassified Campylobacter]NDJ26795.1 helix-turn-helix transcriptional regulator [Campylobacter sp. MIT 19-121]TKX30134.1 XRE family transcriptional regulator [Campylobacter sp. MIT 12-5580]TQR42384.1 XRE family transcriptional regulator [Campylobacter sp. MIT 12-8780]